MNEELKHALQPILDYVRVNDSDTLSRLRKDDELIATASGSWSGQTHITLGDLRRIANLANVQAHLPDGRGGALNAE